MYQRFQTENLLKEVQNKYISVLIGSRQVGKSTLFSIVQKQVQQPFSVYNLENPLHLELFNRGYTSFTQQLHSKLVFIDEFQYCPNIASVFKAMYDLQPDIKIFASGSSSLEIMSHLKESLAGRKKETILYPLSFFEYLSAELKTIAQTDGIESVSPIDEWEFYTNRFQNFLHFGALPGLYGMTEELEKREYLFEIYKTYIAKDIKSFLREESILSFNKMLTWLAMNNTSQLNKHSLSKIVGVSSRQIDRYIEVLEGTFVMASLPPFSKNKSKEITKMPKFYFYDQGIINTIIQDFRPFHLRPDVGSQKEAFVFWELKKYADIRYAMYYWRTSDSQEVDFILVKDRLILPIEVKSQWDIKKIPPGLKAFFSFYPEVERAIVFYDGLEDQLLYENKTIFFAPHYKASKALELL